jgi:hypothetical protein
MNKDFNVYKWRREQLVENKELISPEELAKEFTKEYSTQPNLMFSDRGEGGYRVQIYSKNLKKDMFYPENKKEAKEFFQNKGYNLYSIFDDDRSKNWIWDFNFKKS